MLDLGVLRLLRQVCNPVLGPLEPLQPHYALRVPSGENTESALINCSGLPRPVVFIKYVEINSVNLFDLGC